jgi:GTP cyclohydrolase II
VFENSSVIRLERAVAELRAGRPVIVSSPESCVAALSIDSASAQTFHALSDWAGGPLFLYMTPQRAGALNLAAPSGCTLPLQGLSYETACRFAFLPGADAPAAWKPGNAAFAAASDLARISSLLPAIVGVEIAGTRPHGDAVEVTAVDISKAWNDPTPHVEIVSRTKVPLERGTAEFVVFRGGVAQRDQIALVFGEIPQGGPATVRIHSSCITGDLFGSLKCDCGDQLRSSLDHLISAASGVLLYLDQEGRGTGIASKMRAYEYQEKGLDTFDADAALGFDNDERHYGIAVGMPPSVPPASRSWSGFRCWEDELGRTRITCTPKPRARGILSDGS